jgi:hypothetical protein
MHLLNLPLTSSAEEFALHDDGLLRELSLPQNSTVVLGRQKRIYSIPHTPQQEATRQRAWGKRLPAHTFWDADGHVSDQGTDCLTRESRPSDSENSSILDKFFSSVFLMGVGVQLPFLACNIGLSQHHLLQSVFLSSVNFTGTSVRNHFTVNIKVYFWTLPFILLICLIFRPAAHYPAYCSFVGSFGSWEVAFPRLLCHFCITSISMWILGSAVNTCSEVQFEKDPIEFRDQFRT